MTDTWTSMELRRAYAALREVSEEMTAHEWWEWCDRHAAVLANARVNIRPRGDTCGGDRLSFVELDENTDC